MSPAPGHKLLVVSYFQPPFGTGGASRWLAMTKYLRRRGHEVTVLTTSLMGALADDADQGVVRARDLAGSDALRRLLRRPGLAASGGQDPTPGVAPPAVLTSVLVPDPYLVSWLPFAAAAVRRLVGERGIDCVITTSPPESVHLAGLVAQQAGAAWLADLRDGWTFEPLRAPFPTAVQRRLDERLERLVASRADRVVAATHPMAEDLRARLGIDAAYVPNAWDPELEPGPGADGGVELDEGKVSLVHTGTLGGGWGRDPGPLWQALEDLLAADRALADRLEIVLAGELREEDRDALRARGLEELVRSTGYLPRESALSLQRRADALLLVTSPHHRSEATGKLFEYLGAKRPIVALASGNEAARIVSEAGAGMTVAPDDPAAIAGALMGAVRGELHMAASGEAERHVYPAPADAMAGEIEAAVRARRGGNPPAPARSPVLRASRVLSNPRGHDVNLRSAPQRREYESIAARIARDRPGRVLDWGCGYGQMTWLLSREGLEVEAFNYVPGLAADQRRPLERFPEHQARLSGDPVRLPYPDASFGAVLSCGVLEHVARPDESLDELRRVLAPGGSLYVYKLPNRLSYLEWIARRTGLYYHGAYPDDRLYDLDRAVALLGAHGFRVTEARMANMLPLTVPGRLVDAMEGPIWFLNRALARVPALNRLATNVEAVAVTPNG
ncbi:MAG: methyltransferase domain-containing protein [Actinomycetota bacterium]|nr:methyltransferase domain-containing protein [Actinomycetota bacterium]